MPLAGGPSDKAGNSFERRWTVLRSPTCSLATVRSLRIEVPGEGAEFRLLVADRRTYEERNLEELRERARELDIEGRSAMGKDELTAALRQQAK
jgi:hypothetical protein